MKLQIGSKEVGLVWGIGAIEIYCDKMGCDVDGLDKAITSDKEIERQKALTTLILAAIQNWSELPGGSEFTTTYRQLQQYLSEITTEKYQEILQDWKKSKYFGKTIGEYYFGEIPEATTSKKKSRSGKL